MITAGKRIGQLLKEMRLERGFSQSHVAGSLSIPIRTYQSWENGYTSNVDNLIALCGFYNISPVELFAEWGGHEPLQAEEFPAGSRELDPVEFLDRVMEGRSAEELYELFPAFFLDRRRSPEDRLYRLLLDIYFSRPDLLSSRFPGRCGEAEQAIRKRYSLDEDAVMVVDSGGIALPLVCEILLAFPGSQMITRWAEEKPGFRMGVSNGYTVARILDQLGRGKARNLSLFPMNYTNTPVDFPISSNSIISSFLYRNEGYGNVMDTPGEMEVYGAMLLADAVLLGAGSFAREGLYEKMISSTLGSSVMEAIREAGGVGDLNYHLIDGGGEPISMPQVVGDIGHPENSSLVKAIDLPLLRQKADRGCHVMAAAAGDCKARTIRLSLEKGYINALLVDRRLADELLKG